MVGGGASAGWPAGAGPGAPLTHRGLAQSATIVTGHGAAGETPDLDWAALARPNHTVAIYMGLTTAATLSQRLMAAGRDAATPALIVVDASRPSERRVKTTLARLATAAEGLSGPALLIIGEAMALADDSAAPVETAFLLESVR
jgi:uroporphyrin-III C-methyltransferase